jgi:alpha,alpha-trehalase
VYCRYDVLNTQPRPESFLEDYQTATNKSYYATSGIIYPSLEDLEDEQLARVYANLASGAESGWDFGTRFLSRPMDAARDIYFPLRFLNPIGIVPVDLNSILYGNEMTIAKFLNQTGNSMEASKWVGMATTRSEAMFDLMWNATLMSYFDFNLTSNAQNIYIPADEDTTAAEEATAQNQEQVLFSVAQFYPFWLGAAPVFLKSNPYTIKTVFQRVANFLDEKAGGIPATNYKTGQQWDEPNVWPPLQHILMEALLNTPPTFGEDDPSYTDIQRLALRLGQRYLDSTFCTWYATGGSTSQTPQLPGLAAQDVGTIFEKYADNATNVAGSGGEYTVVEGFGWSNGVLLWTVDIFGSALTRPDCGNITAANVQPQKRGLNLGQRAVELSHFDASFTKKFGRRAVSQS